MKARLGFPTYFKPEENIMRSIILAFAATALVSSAHAADIDCGNGLNKPCAPSATFPDPMPMPFTPAFNPSDVARQCGRMAGDRGYTLTVKPTDDGFMIGCKFDK